MASWLVSFVSRAKVEEFSLSADGTYRKLCFETVC